MIEFNDRKRMVALRITKVALAMPPPCGVVATNVVLPTGCGSPLGSQRDFCYTHGRRVSVTGGKGFGRTRP